MVITKTRPCNIQRIFTAVKNDNFQLIFFYFFHIFAQNIYCGYTLEPPHCILYSKIGVYRGIHYFLIFALKHRLWVLVRTASLRRL